LARVHCPTCGDDLLVARSCQGRGVCPSCCGRRMADTAAHLVDRVLPKAPIRQWVLTLPFALRAPLAFNPGLLSAVLRCFVKVVQAFYQAEAAAAGASDTHTGSVSAIQRFGSALNLNPHFHVLFLDGAYHRPRADGPLVFRPLRVLTDQDVAGVLARFREDLAASLSRWAEEADEDEAAREDAASSPMAQLVLESLGVAGAGPERQRDGTAHRPGGRRQVPRMQPLCVAEAGFSLHARTRVERHRRGALETFHP